MSDLTKYAKGKRMVFEQDIKQIAENTKEIVDLKGNLQGKVNSYIVTDITALTSDFINKLKSGDVVVKQTGSGQHPQYHSYRVSFMKDNEGMCLTYTDASCSETVSYDKSGNNWAYNSTDVTKFSDFATKDELPAEVEAITPTGTETTLEGLKIGDTSYKVGGGGALYMHSIELTYYHVNFQIYSNRQEAYTNTTLLEDLNDKGKINCIGVYSGNSNFIYNSANKPLAITIEFSQNKWCRIVYAGVTSTSDFIMRTSVNDFDVTLGLTVSDTVSRVL